MAHSKMQPSEDIRSAELEAVANLKADLVAVYQPVNSQESFALECMAHAQQAMLRAARLEAGLFSVCLNESLADRPQSCTSALGEGFRRLAEEGNIWTLFLRYQAQAERQYRFAVEEFERLRALRAELPAPKPGRFSVIRGSGSGDRAAKETGLVRYNVGSESGKDPIVI